MSEKFRNITAASLKVLESDLKNYLKNIMNDLGLNNECSSECSTDSAIDLLRAKREKINDKVNSFFDKLESQLHQQEDKATHSIKSEDLAALNLSIKELQHQVNKLQGEIKDLKKDKS